MTPELHNSTPEFFSFEEKETDLFLKKYNRRDRMS